MKTHFKFEKVVTEHLPWVAAARCVRCGGLVFVTRGQVMATFRVNREFVGVSCTDCLAPESRERLAALQGGGR